jgi:hypothetical protein
MAVDMLENNELAALAPSRLGNKNFINDTAKSGKKIYKNISQKEEFSNLFGSKNRKKLVAKVQGKWSNLNTDCSNVDSNIVLAVVVWILNQRKMFPAPVNVWVPDAVPLVCNVTELASAGGITVPT